MDQSMDPEAHSLPSSLDVPRPMPPADFVKVYVETENGHSMPNLEEARTEGAIHAGGSYNRYPGRNKRRVALVVISFAAIALVTGFSVARVQNHNGSGASSATSENGGPSITPVAPQDPSVVTTRAVSRLQAVQDFVVGSNISNEAAFADKTTPQYLAALWIADQDEANVDLPVLSTDVETSFEFLQRYILALFFFALDGPKWPQNVGFMSSASVCDWNFDRKFGAMCNDANAVNNIFITGNKLKGTIPAEIGNLLDMEHLSLFDNAIIGPLPDRMQYLTKLNFLALESNDIAGTLPSWLNKCTLLQYLALGDNDFTGTLPDLTGMTILKEVALSMNDLTGSIDTFNKATRLRLLYLNHNHFNGSIHDNTFSDLSNLETIDLGDNEFTGYFPAHFYDLMEVDLRNNLLAGSMHDVPSASQSNMTFLSLYGNRMTGRIPESLGSLQELKHLDVSDNAMTGDIVDAFDDMANLESLYLSKNKFDEGDIPKLLKSTKLKTLSMAETNRIGDIHLWIGESLAELELLDLHDNKLKSSIPTTLGNLGKLKFLFLNGNMLTGDIPSELDQLSSIDIMFLDDNSVTGTLEPVCAAKLENLELLSADYEGGDAVVLNCTCCTTRCQRRDASCNKSDDLVRLNETTSRDGFLFSENSIS